MKDTMEDFSAVVPENVPAKRKVFNCRTYQIMRKEFHFLSTAVHKIIHKGLNCIWNNYFVVGSPII